MGWAEKPSVGEVFGKWTVVELGHKTSGKCAAVRCRCVCGAEHTLQINSLRYGESRGCRKCSGVSKRRLKQGDRYGLWTVVRRDEENTTYCFCRCECGVEQRVRCGHLRDGVSRMCRGCSRTVGSKGGHRTFWAGVVANARSRGLEVGVDFDFMLNLLAKQKSRCALSGLLICLPTTCHEFRSGKCTASVDRIDSSFGYVPGNVQWVHKTLNVMKMNLSESEFFRLCRLVSDRHPDASDDSESPVVGVVKKKAAPRAKLS